MQVNAVYPDSLPACHAEIRRMAAMLDDWRAFGGEIDLIEARADATRLAKFFRKKTRVRPEFCSHAARVLVVMMMRPNRIWSLGAICEALGTSRETVPYVYLVYARKMLDRMEGCSRDDIVNVRAYGWSLSINACNRLQAILDETSAQRGQVTA